MLTAASICPSRKMKRTQKSVISQVVEALEGGKYRCIADVACRYTQDKYVPGNFKRHLLSQHPRVFDAVGLPAPPPPLPESPVPRKKCKKLLVETDRETVLLGTLQLATVNSLPYSFPEMQGFQTLVGPLYKALGITINRRKVCTSVDEAGEAVRKFIAEEVTGRPLHVKVDSASRNNRHFFGVNIQYYVDGKVVIRNLAIRELHESQTKEHLMAAIKEIMESYGIVELQMFSIAHDNGANMVATVELMKQTLQSCPELERLLQKQDVAQVINEHASVMKQDYVMEEESVCDEVDDGDHVSEDDAEADDFDNSEAVDVNSNICEESDNFGEMIGEMLGSIRCAAHTAQLAVWDVLKSYEKRLCKIQKLVIKMRQVKYHKVIKANGGSLPPLSNRTRWNSTFAMMKSLMNQKASLSALKKSFPELDMTPHWNFIEKYCEALEPVFVLTLKLQKQHVPLSEFYSCWLQCQAVVSRIASNSLATKLAATLKNRITKLMKSMLFKACLYLDPRFNFLGSKRISLEDKEKVTAFLVTLHHRINALEGIQEESVVTGVAHDESSVELEQYLTEFFGEESAAAGKSGVKDDALKLKIKELEMREKVGIVSHFEQVPQPGPSSLDPNQKPNTPFDIIRYWESQKYSNPLVHRLAMVVLSAPSTQVSVERAFSALRHVFSDLRTNLSESSVENTLLCKLNPELLEKVVVSLSDNNSTPNTPRPADSPK